MTLEELKVKYPDFDYYQDIKNNRYFFSILKRINAKLDSATFQREEDYSCFIENNISIDDKLNDEAFIDKLHEFFSQKFEKITKPRSQ
jgi:hypothetical protein